MNHQQTEKNLEEHRVSLVEPDRESSTTRQTDLPQQQHYSSIDKGDENKVTPQIVGIAALIVFVGFLLMFAFQFGVMILANLGVRVSIPATVSILSQIMSLISVLGIGFLVGWLADRRAIIPGIIAGQVAWLGFWFAFILPATLRATHGNLPPIFLVQMVFFSVLGMATQIAVALFVSRRKSSIQNIHR